VRVPTIDGQRYRGELTVVLTSRIEGLGPVSGATTISL
jgi:hypothetical protein